MSEQQTDWVESIEVFGAWGDMAAWQAEAQASIETWLEGEA
ncbi:hypothetical protein [Halomonas sp. B23F22_10]